MVYRNAQIPWRAIIQGIIIIYSVSFAAGFVFALNGITPQLAPTGYTILALAAGAIGVAIALRVAQTAKPSYLLAIGIGYWLLSGTSVLFEAQTVLSWLESSLFVAATVIVGWLMVGTNVTAPTPTPILSYSALVQRATRTRRNA